MSAPTTSYALIESARRGDQDAFARLFERYRRRLAVLIHYRMGPELRAAMEPDDVLQETLLRAFRDLHAFDYRGPGSFMSWLATVARHALLDLAKYHRREQRAAETVRLRSLTNPLGPEPADTVTPSRVLAQEERLQALLARLDALPADSREVILLSRIEGLPAAAVAERLGKTREATAVLLHRALKRFRALGEEHD